ncbi:MAG: PolC-type DNA polymerase III [Bacilli bacterium]|nr:PolC-type DNA polymerase III [Bacilli bacterium]
MEDKIQILFRQLKLDNEHIEKFKDLSLKKVIVNQKHNIWTFVIVSPSLLELDDYILFDKKAKEAFNNIREVYIKIESDKQEKEKVLEYYNFILDKCKKTLLIANIFSDSLTRVEDNKYVIETENVVEEKQAKTIIKEVNFWYNLCGFSIEVGVSLNLEKENSIKDVIKSSLDVDLDVKPVVKNIPVKIEEKEEKKVYKREKKEDDPSCVLGRSIKDNPVLMKGIVGEENNITVEGFVFGTDYFESAKTDFKIITLKITDYSDSLYCKVFVRDNDEYARLKKELKEGKWLKIRGYTKNDPYSKELVLNARDICVLDKVVETIKDNATNKRVELHAHTKMSQMDGLVEAKDLIKQAIKWGHKAIAVTDHNGCQAFPDIYHVVCDVNKGKEEKDKFKAIYGAELVLIDDSVNVVINGTNDSLENSTYVVFDFETTGFNAGGGDSIIEVGAVKIKNGEIIDRYNRLINPGKKLSAKITEVTSITDNMLIGRPDEETVIKEFKEWFMDLPMVAHNAKFDVSFLKMAYSKYNLGDFTNPVIDTLEISRIIDNNYARHNLTALVKRYNVPWDEESHHRADYDAEGTALVFSKMIKKLVDTNYETINDLNRLVSKEEIHKYGRTYHFNILVKDKVGLKNLFKIVSLANTTYLYKGARILRSEVEKHREGLLIGSGCYESEVFIEARSKNDEELSNIINFYDYVEVQPIDCYDHLLQSGDFANKNELKENIDKVIRVTKEAGKLIVATGDVHHLKKDDKIYREIIVNQKVPGGGRHPLARNNITSIPSNHFRTTEEMLNDFDYLGADLAQELVIDNPNKIADMIEIIEVIIETGGIPFSPKIENSAERVRELVYNKAHSMYGDVLPELIEERIDQELTGIIKGGFDVIYLIAQMLVKKSNDDGYIVGSRGSVGSSFVATMMGITEVNPLPAHYLCRECKTSLFEVNGEALGKEYSSGYDLPDMNCPKCNALLGKEGQDMPFATFLGFDADKVPDIDLNFSGEYQWRAHEYTKELFGIDNVYRAGTIGTVADKTAFGFVKGYCEDKGISNMRTAETERIALGCTGVKRTTGQHPGGIVVIPGYMDVFDFTPFQFPADDPNSLWRTTHFDYHAIDQDVLKLDILGHDDPTVLRMLQDLSGIDVLTLPFDDPKVLSLLSSTEALGVKEEDVLCPTGTLGLPELGTKFVINMLVETKPKSFGELVKISGLSHGTDVWAGNASELIANNVVPFKKVIGCRDDIMVNLMNWGMEPKKAFKIMEFVRKGKPSKEPEAWAGFAAEMKEKNIPEWYIESCRKIKYMFPKAHACAYVMSALRVAWFKVYKPVLYYCTFMSIRANDFDIDTMIKGYNSIKNKMEELTNKGYEASNKETNILETLKIALEASARGVRFGDIDIYKSDDQKFTIAEDGVTLIPPFRTIEGLGENVAKNIVEERKIRPFISIEDLQKRGKISSTIIDRMRLMGILKELPESSQMTLF